ncbi:DNA topoisomerase IV subunit A [Mycoplasma crocodyli]|uniref:DNA topoisomerase (ATP-hydrolyzing) n=1 Tax=Mycoplasma crocodyli (strain ATCC 51981 / MP145) TaxID=512564 RepID=D5E651_MYCCM|nr:DNA topoisomerase IV subunit A [Mycoplasma crocodyli]ADE19424.1 DNA topoisomerase IV, A subunit [Mycoplasma crocodyli MP145]
MNKEKEEIVERIINNSLDKIMAERFGRYSKYIIQQRALPDVRDGLKPVHRRILYAMSELGLTNDKPYKKSARVVGDVIGKYHPHGDTSVYDAMVNMSQWWKSGIPLLDMHGNVGSLDNDPAAAMRYTEVRMAKVCNYMLEDLKKNTVAFIPNFDDSEKEPSVLPTIFPNLLVNGTTGIAIGMATEMPPHNLNEVLEATIAKLRRPSITLDGLMEHIKGPDFPTGGIIYGNKGVFEAFESGKLEKEKIKLFCKYEVVKKDKLQFIEITEIPFGVVKSQLVYDIDVLINTETIDGLLEIKDQSDREGIKIVITLSEEANVESIISFLLQKTSMQVNYSYNNVVIHNNSPKLMGLNELLEAYIEHIKIIKTRTLTYDLEKYLLRLEIVLGFIKVSEIPDKVIKVIRATEGGKAAVIENLMNAFNFTTNQATAIAELRLYRLSKTDKEAFLIEQADLEKKIANTKELLDDEKKFVNYLILLLKQMIKDMPTPRRTQIFEEEFTFNHDKKDLVKEEIVNIAFSKLGYIKRLSQKVVDSNDFSTFALKEDDYLLYIDKANTVHNFLVFTNWGNYAIIPVYKIQETKWKELGTHLSAFVDLAPGENIINVIEVEDWNSPDFIVMATKLGFFKRTKIKDFEVSRTNKTYTAINIDNKDEVINVAVSDGTKDILIITAMGFATKYNEAEISLYGPKAKGTKGVYLVNKDFVACFTPTHFNDIVIMISDDGYIKKMKSREIYYVPKTAKGKEIFKNRKLNPYFISDMHSSENDEKILIKLEDNKIAVRSTKDYSITNSDDSFTKIKTDSYMAGFIKKEVKAYKFDRSKAYQKIIQQEEEQDINKTLEIEIIKASKPPRKSKESKEKTLEINLLTDAQKPKKSEEQRFKDAEDQINTFDLNVEELLAKINRTLGDTDTKKKKK